MKRFSTPILLTVIALVTLFGPWERLHDWTQARCEKWPAIARALVSCAPCHGEPWECEAEAEARGCAGCEP